MPAGAIAHGAHRWNAAGIKGQGITQTVAVCADRRSNVYACEREDKGDDGGSAVAVGLIHPHGSGTNGAGDLFVADTHNHQVRVVGL